MAVDKKIKKITKTVDLRDNKPEEKKSALVIKAKKMAGVDKEALKTINENVKAKKAGLAEVEKEIEVKKEKVAETQPETKYQLSIDLKDLLAAGCHLGHKMAKTSPKARDYIYASRDGIEIVDLIKTKEMLENACNFIYQSVKSGKSLVLVGTKRQAREVVRRVAVETGTPYVTDRWLGGTITNWEQIRRLIKRQSELKEGLEKGKFVENTKKEISLLNKEMIKLEKMVGGLKGLDKLFDVLFAVDIGFEKTAIREANLRGVATVGMVDTDSNPMLVNYAILANDDSNKSVNLIVEEIGKAIAEGRKNQEKK